MGEQQFSMAAKADLEALFKEIDMDASGEVSFKELTGYLKGANIPHETEMLKRLMDKCDSDGNASLNLKEFRMAGPLLMDMKMIAMMQTQGKTPPADVQSLSMAVNRPPSDF